MATEAFGARRVTESLKAIARHLDNAALAAGAVRPLGNAPLVLSPRLTDVVWEPAGSHTISLPQSGVSDQILTVHGSGLNSVTSFKLVAGSRYFEAKPTPISPTGTILTAMIRVTAPSSGTYDAWVETEVGSFLLPDGCAIEAPAAAPPVEQTPQLATLVPNQWTEEEGPKYAVLVVLNGVSPSLSITDLNGTPAPGWYVEKADESSVRNDIDLLKPIYGPTALYQGLKITTRPQQGGRATAGGPRPVPTRHGAFYLVATSAGHPAPAARLAFVVKRSQPAQQEN
jgi:hypothetical protein